MLRRIVLIGHDCWCNLVASGRSDPTKTKPQSQGSYTNAGKEATYATLREIAKRKPWFTRLTQASWAALLVSEQTRHFYAHGNIME